MPGEPTAMAGNRLRRHGQGYTTRSDVRARDTNTVSQRPHRGPRGTKRRASALLPQKPDPARLTKTIGIDFGSSAWSAAITDGSGPPESIPLGQVNNSHDGTLVLAYKFPTYTRFGGDERFRITGHEDVLDFTDTSSGLKQSLDDDLCKPGSEGQKTRELCEKNNTTPSEVLEAQLAALLEFITAELRKRGISQTQRWRVNFAVPVMWTCDERGKAIQKQIAACAIKAGFPDDIAFDAEPFLTDAYIRHHEQPKTERLRSRIQAERLHIDVGAATTDFTCRAAVGNNGVVLTRDPDGCAGGMSYFWPRLSKLCKEMGIDILAARRYVYQLHDDSTDFRQGDKVIRVSVIKTMIDKCFEESIQMAQNILKGMPRVRRIDISGGATSSNRYIQSFWWRSVQCAGQASREGSNHALDVQFLGPEDAVVAVCMAAAVPFSDNPLPRFHAWCFGFRCQDPEGREFIQQVKPQKSPKLRSDWEQVLVDDKDPSSFEVDPYMVTGGKQLKKKSHDTFHPVWPMDHAVPMGAIEFDLAGHVLPGQKVGVRFTRQDAQIIILEVDCRNGEVKKRTLELCGDRERVYFIETLDQQQPDPTADQIERQLEQDGEKGDSQLIAREQTSRQPEQLQPTLLNAEVDQNGSPMGQAEQQHTIAPDTLTGPDAASIEHGQVRSTPERLPPPNVYDVPQTSRRTPGKRKRAASEATREKRLASQNTHKRALSSRTPQGRTASQSIPETNRFLAKILTHSYD
ncbi:hypothetical protein VHEMI10689 [[Torrubiella] hemipterigena]|uniref:Uncharacterized protein n=1 Tax=[Torrubiella] hemipterigena TaxID=1531966 RepID=A0A0A1TTM9_9HYPO|nr:hypothetical protein VHEMI10689 [[Torrubiella] hemipterigena]